MSALAQAADLVEYCLLAGVGLDVLSVRAKPIAERDVAHALAVLSSRSS
jgi:hypothetical protein